MKNWFCNTMLEVPFRCKETVFLWVFEVMKVFPSGLLWTLLKKIAYGTFTCLIALVLLVDVLLFLRLIKHERGKNHILILSFFGGAVVGTIVGAVKGQTTETGLLGGAGIGAVAGAITAIQLVESVLDGDPISSKVELLFSLVNGKIFTEWVGPAVLKAYQWQLSASEAPYRDVSDIYDASGFRGLSKDCIQMLPEYAFNSQDIPQHGQTFCSICLQGIDEGDSIKKLPSCGHFFHRHCIDTWLSRNGSCPICRDCICLEANIF